MSHIEKNLLPNSIMIIMLLLFVGFSFSRYVGPMGSVTPPAFDQKSFAMWTSPCGLYHEMCFTMAASRKSPRVSTS